MSKANMIPMQSTADTAADLEAFLKVGRDLVAETEPQTRTWYALSREDDARAVAIFDTFENQQGREAHFSGQVAAALRDKAPALVSGGWDAILAAVNNYEVLAAVERQNAAEPTKATYLPLRAAEGQEEELAALLTGGGALVEQTEPATLTWYALRSESDPAAFAVFDLFPDADGRAAHFNGQVAAALHSKAGELIAGGWQDGVLANVQHYDVRAAK